MAKRRLFGSDGYAVLVNGEATFYDDEEGVTSGNVTRAQLEAAVSAARAEGRAEGKAIALATLVAPASQSGGFEPSAAKLDANPVHKARAEIGKIDREALYAKFGCQPHGSSRGLGADTGQKRPKLSQVEGWYAKVGGASGAA